MQFLLLRILEYHDKSPELYDGNPYQGCLATLNPGKSGGPDGCHPYVLQEVKEGVITPFIFKKSI